MYTTLVAVSASRQIIPPMHNPFEGAVEGAWACNAHDNIQLSDNFHLNIALVSTNVMLNGHSVLTNNSNWGERERAPHLIIQQKFV